MVIKLVRARGLRNKLEVMDNRPFAVDFEFLGTGFAVNFLDLTNGHIETAAYLYRDEFDSEWEVINTICYNYTVFEE